jgi:hypothetical protein
MKTNEVIKYCLLALLIVGFSACSDSDNGPSTENSMKMNGSAFEVSTVSLVGVSLDGEGHAAVTFTHTAGSVTKVLTVDFEYSPSAQISGNYAYPSVNSERLIDDWLTNYTEFSGDNEMTSTNLEEGTVILQDNGGSNYTITLDLTMLDGKTFKGTYKGPVVAAFNNG